MSEQKRPMQKLQFEMTKPVRNYPLPTMYKSTSTNFNILGKSHSDCLEEYDQLMFDDWDRRFNESTKSENTVKYKTEYPDDSPLNNILYLERRAIDW